MLLVPVVIFIIACSTCNTSTLTPTPAVEIVTSEPSGGTASGDILLYSDVNGKAGDQIDSFLTTQHKLHFSAEVDTLKKGQKVLWVLTAVKAGTLTDEKIGELPMDVPIDGVTKLSAALSNDSDWPSGLYQIDLYIDGSIVKTGQFQIATPG